MRAARIAVLLAAACRASPPSSPGPAAADAQAVSCVEQWLAQRDLNQYGDPVGTMYTGARLCSTSGRARPPTACSTSSASTRSSSKPAHRKC